MNKIASSKSKPAIPQPDKSVAYPFQEKIKLALSVEQIRSLLGERNQHLDLIEESLRVKIDNRGDAFQISAQDSEAFNHALNVFYELIDLNQKSPLTLSFLARYLQENSREAQKYQDIRIPIGRQSIAAKSANQAKFIKNLNRFAINFATGPAGTGKSWLSVAYALSCFDSGLVNRIVLTRPVLEAGEKLGFLPGDLTQKIDPFLKPLYDALYEMYPVSQIDQLMANKKIEILPLAYMRGRTLNEAVVILDEAQNTTPTQMKMFLTRMGYNSKLIISGDLNQNDLPNGMLSGLLDAKNRLEHLTSIGFCNFDNTDIIRHPLVREILECYETNKPAPVRSKKLI